jgi:putative pyruvate formate lyase activating enzyme
MTIVIPSNRFSHREASYVYLTDEEWDQRIARLFALTESCTLCPRICGVNRQKEQHGFCGAPGEMVISSIFPHHGEEPPISGTRGSGTVFFSYCSLQCCFCQNYQISHENEGKTYSSQELADEMLGLQNKGCHNINLVTATHFLPWVISALKAASKKGLTIPIVYNCSGYESENVISALHGIIDIYLPDMKYGNALSAQQFSKAADYVEANQTAIRAMFRQVGSLKIGSEGIAYHGLCIRHLVLPNDSAASYIVLNFLKSAFDPQDIYISLMAQYRPLYKADQFSEISRMVSAYEYESVKKSFLDAGFQGFFQEITEMDKDYIIDFKKRKTEALTGRIQIK